jgi:hypothetical protein
VLAAVGALLLLAVVVDDFQQSFVEVVAELLVGFGCVFPCEQRLIWLQLLGQLLLSEEGIQDLLLLQGCLACEVALQ